MRLHPAPRSALLLALGIFFTAVLAACGGGYSPNSGTITAKQYDDPDTWTTRHCTMWTKPGGGISLLPSVDPTRICLSYAEDRHTDGPHFYFQIEDRKGKGTVEVRQRRYEACQVGDFFTAARCISNGTY